MTLMQERPAMTASNESVKRRKRGTSWWRGRRWPRMAVGLAITVLCLVAIARYTGGGEERLTVLVTAAPLQAGQVITESDLAQVSVAPSDVTTIDAADMDSLIGRMAALPLAAGTLVSPSMIGPASVPGPGRAEATFALADGAFPAGLEPGANVLVLAVIDETAGVAPWQMAAVVRTVEPVDGGAQVGLEFAATDSAGLARARTHDPVVITVGPPIEAAGE